MDQLLTRTGSTDIWRPARTSRPAPVPLFTGKVAAGKVVVCALNGAMTVKRLLRWNGGWVLAAENPLYADIALNEGLDLVVWGVVTTVIHPL
jgi:hypothetical protein